MPLEPTDSYLTHLADLHQQLLASLIVRTYYLTGTGIRFDGVELAPFDHYELRIGTLTIVEFAHLFSLFDGSRVHEQVQSFPGSDDAPPGLYFSVANARLIQHPNKNRLQVEHQRPGSAGVTCPGLGTVRLVRIRVQQPPTRPGEDPGLGVQRLLAAAQSSGEGQVHLALDRGGADTHGGTTALIPRRAIQAAAAGADRRRLRGAAALEHRARRAVDRLRTSDPTPRARTCVVSVPARMSSGSVASQIGSTRITAATWRGRALNSHLHWCSSRARYAKIYQSPRCRAVELQAR